MTDSKNQSKFKQLLAMIAVLFVLVYMITITIMYINIKHKLVEYNDTTYEYKKDSLNAVINVQNSIINDMDKRIDSLYEVKSKTQVYYGTTIQNFTNPSIVSDDSITRFISKKIHNQ